MIKKVKRKKNLGQKRKIEKYKEKGTGKKRRKKKGQIETKRK